MKIAAVGRKSARAFSHTVSGIVRWLTLPGNRRRLGQVFVRSLVRRTEFRWWHGVFLLYVALLWRSTRKTSLVNGGEYWKKLYEKGSAWRTVVAAHVVLFKYIVTKASLGALLLQNVTYQAALAPRYAADFVGKQSAALQERLQTRVEDFLDRQMDMIGEKVKTLLKDPYMPVSIQATIEDFVDVLLPDLKLALFTKTNEYISSYRSTGLITHPNATVEAAAAAARKRRRSKKHSPRKSEHSEEIVEEQVPDEVDTLLQELEDSSDEDSESQDEEVEDDSSDEEDGEEIRFRDLRIASLTRRAGVKKKKLKTLPKKRESLVSRTRFAGSVMWQMCQVLTPSRANIRYRFHMVRSWVLYTLSPFDRSFWRSIRNPSYLLLTAIGLIPMVGTLWWMFVFFLHDKRDEYQLSQFIVGFQTAKFFSQGCFNLLRGAFLYYICATRDVPSCDIDGPKARDYIDALSFVLQILIVWLTFFILPYSEPCYAVNDPKHAFLLDEGRNDRSQAALRAKVRLGRGGRLMHLFWWDTVIILVVFSLGAFAYFVLEQRDWKFRSTCYWLATMYGLASLPFVPFKLPIMGNLLTPTRATGYTRTGDTVLRVIREAPEVLIRVQLQETERRRTARRPSTLAEVQSPADSLPTVDHPSFSWTSFARGWFRKDGEQLKVEDARTSKGNLELEQLKGFFLSDTFEEDLHHQELRRLGRIEEESDLDDDQTSVPLNGRLTRIGPLAPLEIGAASSLVASEITETSQQASSQLMKNLHRLRSSSSLFE